MHIHRVLATESDCIELYAFITVSKAMIERHLPLKEVSKILGVTCLTLRNWDRKGLLRAYRNPFNNYRMYRYADVADLLAQIHNPRRKPAPIQKLEVRIEPDGN